MTRVLVTGGSGFIGTNLVDYYKSRGDDVINLDIAPPRCDAHADSWRRVDLLDLPALQMEVERFAPELVFHMAARTDLHGVHVGEYQANTVGLENLISSIIRVKCLKLAVFASSMLVCRIGYIPRDELDYCPSTPYGESKVVGERTVREGLGGRLPWVIVRPTSIWGPWFASPYRDFFEVVRRGWYFHPAGVQVRRSYGYVGNAVHLLAKLAEVVGGQAVHRAIYLADFDPIDVRIWASTIAEEFGVRPVRELPLAMFRAAARVGDLARRCGWSSPPMSSFRLNNMLTPMVFDLGPMQCISPQLPYSMDDGVRLTCEWLKRSS